MALIRSVISDSITVAKLLVTVHVLLNTFMYMGAGSCEVWVSVY